MIKSIICRLACGGGLLLAPKIAVFPEGARIESVRPHDNTTSSAAPACSNINPSSPILPTAELLQTAGACLRMSDLDEIGDFSTSPCSAFSPSGK